MFPKRRPIRSKAVREAARDELCLVRSPWCDGVGVVLCHSNFQEDGHGKGVKSDDTLAAFGCGRCNAWLDQGPAPREEKRDVFHRALKRTWRRLIEREIVSVTGVKVIGDQVQ